MLSEALRWMATLPVATFFCGLSHALTAANDTATVIRMPVASPGFIHVGGNTWVGYPLWPVLRSTMRRVGLTSELVKSSAPFRVSGLQAGAME